MSEPVRTHFLLDALPVMTEFPIPLKYRTFPLEDNSVVPSHVVHVDVSVEYSSVPFQFFSPLFVFKVKLLGELNVRYGL